MWPGWLSPRGLRNEDRGSKSLSGVGRGGWTHPPSYPSHPSCCTPPPPTPPAAAIPRQTGSRSRALSLQILHGTKPCASMPVDTLGPRARLASRRWNSALVMAALSARVTDVWLRPSDFRLRIFFLLNKWILNKSSWWVCFPIFFFISWNKLIPVYLHECIYIKWTIAKKLRRINLNGDCRL